MPLTDTSVLKGAAESSEPLNPVKHDRAAFCSGVAALDIYLQRTAAQDASKGVAVTWVLTSETAPSEIMGYYSLSAGAVLLSDFPPEVAKKLPKYPVVPTTLIGRLAVDERHQGKGLGAHLLMDALYRILHTTRVVASAAVVVDAKDEISAAFFKHHDFRSLPSDPRRLILPMATVKRAFLPSSPGLDRLKDLASKIASRRHP